ncbi:MAG TPA: mycothiol synthase [Streptosporangiaceae bacterium]|nr:mycothiol synthase [Streptosporangiaceae bacterium]
MATASPQPAAPGVSVAVSGQLTADQAAAVLAVVQRAADEDGVSPLSEHVMLHLRYGGDPRARNILLWRDGSVAGYAHLDPTDPVEGPSGEMVIDPPLRRQGLGVILGRAMVEEAGQAGLRLWAHGELPAAARMAAAAGFSRTRALWQMRRSLQARIDRPQVAAGIRIRTFVPGQDEDAWVRLNHRAFSRHPEQGAWTIRDLEMREREPWFDPDGFFLADRDGTLAGFHWTKIHGALPGPQPGDGAARAERAEHGHEAIGEVYVVGVDPGERGTGLGRALTLVGLRYLRAQGLSQVMLYVDETNSAAIGLYESLGFTHWDTDVMYSLHPES